MHGEHAGRSQAAIARLIGDAMGCAVRQLLIVRLWQSCAVTVVFDGGSKYEPSTARTKPKHPEVEAL
jgi:hypothetical protein